jgi:hypothetical protein
MRVDFDLDLECINPKYRGGIDLRWHNNEISCCDIATLASSVLGQKTFADRPDTPNTSFRVIASLRAPVQ